MFHSALKVKQPGYVTRIASGCSEEDAAAITKWHRDNIESTMSDRFQLHLTPHFSSINGKDYKFFNKPFGLRHWMEQAEGMGFDEATGKMKDEDMVIILIDPDMVLLRPITGDFSNPRETIPSGHGKDRKLHFDTVQHGQPVAQKYGFGSQWKTKINMDEISGPGSPVNNVSKEDALQRYPAGPPYLATARDMHAISVKWTEFAPGVHKQYPFLLAEMFAFSLAAAHLELPHQLIDSLMISNAGAGEGWELINKIPREETCHFAQSADHEQYPVPSVIHFCQRYNVGPWLFAKHRTPKDIFSCESPLFREPESDIATKYNYKKNPEGETTFVKNVKTIQDDSFMICALTRRVNDAALYFKKVNKCENGGNTVKTITFVEDELFENT